MIQRTLFILITLLITMAPVSGAVRVKLKDISFIDGMKENQVYGYGLVVGLQGTGDSKSPLTRASLQNLLKNLGLEGQNVISKNAAAVLLTANLVPFMRLGDKVDITVSSIGDAKSLKGGILVQSALKGANGQTYVVAQGPLSLPERSTSSRPVKTVARITGGGLVEREIQSAIIANNRISVILRNWDFNIANQVIKAVTAKYPNSAPTVVDGSKIRIQKPNNLTATAFIADIMSIEVDPDYRAIVVIHEQDGTIVAGGNVRISEALVSRDGLLVEIEGGSKKVSASQLKEASTVKELVDSLNVIGASTKDIISILKALKESGALHADLIVR